MAEPNHGVDGDEDNTAEEKADDDGDDIFDLEEFEDLASPHLFVFSRGDKNVFIVAEKVGLEDDNHGERSLVLAEITSLFNSGFVTGIRDPWRTESRHDVLIDYHHTPQRKRQRQCGQRRTQRITVYRGPSFYITEKATHDGYYISNRSVEYRGKESKQNILEKLGWDSTSSLRTCTTTTRQTDVCQKQTEYSSFWAVSSLSEIAVSLQMIWIFVSRQVISKRI
jgi:hypothetical protein